MAETPALPDKVVYYPIAGDSGDETSGRLFIYGNNKNAKNVVLLCAGYPDDQGAFCNFAKKLSREADCLCGIACLIGYDDYPERPYTSYRDEGYTFDQMIGSLQAAARALKVYYSTNPEAQFVTIFHDWGSAIGCLYTNRAFEEGDALVTPDKIVYFDVLPTKLHPKDPNTVEPQKKTLYGTALEVTYRIVFAVAFLIQRFISKYLAAVFFVVSFMILPLVRLVPKNPLDDELFKKSQKNLFRIIYMAYPYYYMFRAMFNIDYNVFNDFCLPLLDETPVLYLYGDAKPIQFHDENIVKYLQEQGKKKDSKSNAIAVPNAAHWLYLQQPDACFEAVSDFILA